MVAARDVADVGAVLEDRLRESIEHTGFITRGDEEPKHLAIRHAQKITPGALSLRGVGPARRTELARNSPGSLAHCSRQPLCKAAWKDALGRVNDSNRADRAAGVVEDRGRDARLAEHSLVALRGDTLVPARRAL